MTNLGVIDYFLVILYFIFLIYVGYYFKKKVSVPKDYFLAGRSLGFFVIMATVCASIIGGGAMIGRGGVTYNQGVVSILLALPYLIGMYFFSFISGRIQKVGLKYNISSIPELMEYRFGRAPRYLSAALITFTMMATVGTQITATATIIKIIGGVSYELSAWIAAIIFVSYTMMSGLYGVVYTDVVQFLILMVFLYILLPIISVTKVGGFTNLISSVPKEMFSFDLTPELLGWIFTSLIFTLAGAEMWQRSFAAKTSKDAFRGMFFGNTFYAYTIIITVVLGLSGKVLLPNLIDNYGNADAVIPAMAINLLPVGITGLTLAALLAVLMSSSDTYLLISVQSLVSDIIKPIFPNLDDKKELLYSRIFTVVLGLCALIISLYIRQAYKALMFAWTFYASSLGIPAFLALYWKKATSVGIISGIISGFVISILWKIIGSPFGLSTAIPGAMICLIVIVVVSIITNKSKPSIFPV